MPSEQTRDDVAKRTIAALRRTSEALEASGGDIDKSGLPVTRYEQCPQCHGSRLHGGQFCQRCQGSGVARVRTINGEPTDE